MPQSCLLKEEIGKKGTRRCSVQTSRGGKRGEGRETIEILKRGNRVSIHWGWGKKAGIPPVLEKRKKKGESGLTVGGKEKKLLSRTGQKVENRQFTFSAERKEKKEATLEGWGREGLTSMACFEKTN